jgi:hypothetical protein
LLNIAAAPDAAGVSVNVTLTPGTGLLPLSRTVATSGFVNAVLIFVLCPLPLVAVIEAAVPTVFVNEKFAGVATPDTLADTVYGPPTVAFALTGADTCPEAFVVKVMVFELLLNIAAAPDAAGVSVNVTLTPGTGLLPLSSTVATSGFVNAVLIFVLCPLPLVAVIEAAVPTVFVNEKFAGVATPDTVADTVYGPPTLLFADRGADTWPEALVVSVIVFELLLNIAAAPDAAGVSVNVTLTPDTGLLPLSSTVATSGLVNAVLIFVLCPPPLVAVMLAGPLEAALTVKEVEAV